MHFPSQRTKTYNAIMFWQQPAVRAVHEFTRDQLDNTLAVLRTQNCNEFRLFPRTPQLCAFIPRQSRSI